MAKAAPFLPEFQFEPPATSEERALFAKAIPDSINTGVFDSDGKRRSPTYDHHVDDNMYADVKEFPRSVAASVIALNEIVGYPNDFSRRNETAALSLFPAESRLLILSGIQAVHRTMAGKPHAPKVARTIRNRRLHYFLFCYHLMLTDDWTLEHQSQERANLQLAMYATHLATGSTLMLRSVKASTINSYLHDMQPFSASSVQSIRVSCRPPTINLHL
ncbi:hypothetical protein MHU86_12880 [Fragilaria crotonensis]|nr:hypothetical protein MHU86_12880 [Fragilaria crotonensis]